MIIDKNEKKVNRIYVNITCNFLFYKDARVFCMLAAHDAKIEILHAKTQRVSK